MEKTDIIQSQYLEELDLKKEENTELELIILRQKKKKYLIFLMILILILILEDLQGRFMVNFQKQKKVNNLPCLEFYNIQIF
jgi:hypothetical protein